MPRVIMGYGTCTGYTLGQLPPEELETLRERFPLALDEKRSPHPAEALITLAVHAEILRRQQGGMPERRPPALAALAHRILDCGYRHALLEMPDEEDAARLELVLRALKKSVRKLREEEENPPLILRIRTLRKPHPDWRFFEIPSSEYADYWRDLAWRAEFED